MEPECLVAQIDCIDESVGQDIKELNLWGNKVISIGRDPNPEINSLAIGQNTGDAVSRLHCEFYVVVYEPQVHHHIYVRDRKSLNGTLVNGRMIGSRSCVMPGYLLQDGDVVEILPHWKFKLRLLARTPQGSLANVQLRECKHFQDRLSVSQYCLGRGGEATIYLAINQATQRQLACKIIDLGGASARLRLHNQRQRMLQEVDVLRQLHHPNIVKYIHSVCSPNTIFIFTELATGGDLMSFLYQNPLPEEALARVLLRQLTRGLRYLHSKDIVHRDLKPENVLLLSSPGKAYPHLLLSDFGTCGVPETNRMKTLVGTDLYQAPELLRVERQYTNAIDMWSLGITALMLLTVDGRSLPVLRSAKQKDITELITQAFGHQNIQLPSSAKAFVEGCIQVNPKRRLNSAEASRHR